MKYCRTPTNKIENNIGRFLPKNVCANFYQRNKNKDL